MDSFNVQGPFFGPTQPVYPPLIQTIRVTTNTIPGPQGYASTSVNGPYLYLAYTQQLQPSPLMVPRDREPCLANDLNGNGLCPGYYNARLAGSFNGLPVYDIGYATFCPTPPGSSIPIYGSSSVPGGIPVTVSNSIVNWTDDVFNSNSNTWNVVADSWTFNSSVVTWNSTTLVFNKGQTFNTNTSTDTYQSGSIINVQSGAVFNLGTVLNVQSGGNINLQTGSSLTTQSGSTVNVQSTTTFNLGTTLNVQGSGSIILQSGAVVNFTAGAALTVASGASVTTSSGSTITVGGVFNVASGGTETVQSGGTFNVASGGTLTTTSGATLTIGNAATVSSTGSLSFASGSTLTVAYGSNLIAASGSTTTLGGTTNISSTGTATVQSGGSLIVSSGGTLTTNSGATTTFNSLVKFTGNIGFFGVTPISQPTGGLATAIGNLGLVGSPGYRVGEPILGGGTYAVLTQDAAAALAATYPGSYGTALTSGGTSSIPVFTQVVNSLSAGTGITLSGSTGNVTISASGGGGGTGQKWTVVNKATNYSANIWEAVLCSASLTVTLPDATAGSGDKVLVKNTGTLASGVSITVAPQAGQQIDPSGFSLPTLASNGFAVFFRDGTQWWTGA